MRGAVKLNNIAERLAEYASIIDVNLDSLTRHNGLRQQTVVDAVRYSLLSQGKRVRGALVLAWCQALGGQMDDALDFGVAVEMLHCYSLIHDDLPCMDDDDVRRGKPSCHKRYGEAVAILAGDALLTLSFSVIAGGAGSDRSKVNAVRELSDAGGMLGMIGGQTIDIERKGHLLYTDELMNLHGLKTAALMAACCKLGVIAARGDDDSEMLKKAALYGEKLGLCFQLIDDKLDDTIVSKELLELAQRLTNEAVGIAREVVQDGEFLTELPCFLLSRKL